MRDKAEAMRHLDDFLKLRLGAITRTDGAALVLVAGIEWIEQILAD